MFSRLKRGHLAAGIILVGLLWIGCGNDSASAFGCQDSDGRFSAECDDGNQCTFNVCDTGNCKDSSRNEGGSCNMGLLSGICRAGQCDGAGAGGTGGTGGAFSATIEGEVRDTDGTGLPGVFVRAVLDSVGTPLVETDDTTRKFQIMVSMPGDYELCAIGVVQQRFVSTNCAGDVAEVTESPSTVTRNLSIRTGYYMSIESGPWNLSEGASIRLMLDYQVWNRSGASDSTTWIVLGIEDSAQLNPHPVGNAGTYTGTADRAFLDFTASSPGRIFARLIPTSTADKAIIAYEEGFDPATSDRNYVEIGMVTAN